MTEKKKFLAFLTDLLPVLENHQATISYSYDGDTHGIEDNGMYLEIGNKCKNPLYFDECYISANVCRESIAILTRQINVSEEIQLVTSEKNDWIIAYTLINGEYYESKRYGFTKEYVTEQVSKYKSKMECTK